MHLASHEVIDFSTMILVVCQALVHVRALQIGEAAADLIYAGALTYIRGGPASLLSDASTISKAPFEVRLCVTG